MAKETYTYRNLGGRHTTTDGRVIEYGEVFECDDPNLTMTFINKFVRHQPGDPASAPLATSGADVTADYNVAAEADLTVRRDPRGLWVFDGDEIPINEEPLDETTVNNAINEYLAAVK